MAQKTVLHCVRDNIGFWSAATLLMASEVKEDVRNNRKKGVLKDSWNCRWLRKKVRKEFQRKE